MSIKEFTSRGKEGFFKGKFSKMMDQLSGSSKELFGNLKGEVVIRKMIAVDEDETKSMIKNVLLEFGGITIDSYYFDEDLEYLYETYTRKGARIVVAVKNGEVIGSAAIKSLRCPSGKVIDGVCELNQFFVKSEFRGQGFGCRMLEKLLLDAKSMGYDRCHVSTSAVFANFKNILKHCGFEWSDLKVEECNEKMHDEYYIKEI